MNDAIKTKDIDLSRRHLLKLGAFGLLAGLCPSSSFAKMRVWQLPEKTLSFYNTHTEESLKTVYWTEGRYLVKPLAEINHIMRDYRTGETKSIDPRLLDLLHSVQP